jgi:hypothetical protein
MKPIKEMTTPELLEHILNLPFFYTYNNFKKHYNEARKELDKRIDYTSNPLVKEKGKPIKEMTTPELLEHLLWLANLPFDKSDYHERYIEARKELDKRIASIPSLFLKEKVTESKFNKKYLDACKSMEISLEEGLPHDFCHFSYNSQVLSFEEYAVQKREQMIDYAVKQAIEQHTGKPFQLSDLKNARAIWENKNYNKFLLIYNRVKLGVIEYSQEGNDFKVTFHPGETTV